MNYHLGIIGRIPFRSKLSVVPFTKEEFCLAIPTSHRFATMQTVGFKELAHEPIIIREDGSGSRYAILLHAQLPRHQAIGTAWRRTALNSSRSILFKGGASVFSTNREIRLEAQLGLLKPLTLEEGPILVQTDVIFPKDVDLNPATRAFLRLA